MAFAAWYAAVGSIIDWPEPVVRVQQSERARRLSLDRMMKLLSQVNYTFSGRTNAAHARMLLEGYAVHEWVQRQSQEFIALAASQQETFALVRHVSDTVLETLSPFAGRVTELGRGVEQDILSFASLTTVSDEFTSSRTAAAADIATRRSEDSQERMRRLI